MSPRHVVRKLQPASPSTFDEQLWPIYVAVIVLGAYLLGIVLSALRFDDPRWHVNAATWVAATIILIGLTIWSIRLVQSRWLRRTVLLSLVLSVIANVSLMVVMAWTSVFHPPWLSEQSASVPDRQTPIVVVPEYHIVPLDSPEQPKQDFEKPVETGTPEAEYRFELARQQQQSAEQQPAIPTPEELPLDVSSVLPERVVVQSAPRRSEQQATLSRQLSPVRPRLAETGVPETSPAAADAQAATLRPQVTRNQRSSTEMLGPPRPAQPEEATAYRQETLELARRTTQQAPYPAAANLANLPRRVPTAESPPAPTKIETPVPPVGVARSGEATLNNTAIERQATTANIADLPAPRVELSPSVTASLSRMPRAEAPAERPTELEVRTAEPQRSLASRAAVASTSVSSVQTEVDPSTPQQLQASEGSRVVRAESSSSLPADAIAAVAIDAIAQQDVPSQAPAKATQSGDEVGSTLEAPSRERQPPRAARAAAVAVSPESLPNAGVASELAHDARVPVEPSRMALARSSLGVAGVGTAANLDRGVPAPEKPIDIPSTASDRARAVQELDPGPAITPHAPAVTRRMRAARDTPSTTAKATSAEVPRVPGSTQTAQLDASASAALDRASSNAPPAPITAGQGQAEIDVGPTLIAADTGRGRAAGGGQPQVSLGQQPRSLSRSTSAAPSVSTIAASAEAEYAAAPRSNPTALGAAATDIGRQRLAAAPAGAPAVSSALDPGRETATGDASRLPPDPSKQSSRAIAPGDALARTRIAQEGLTSPARAAREVPLATGVAETLPAADSYPPDRQVQNALTAQGIGVTRSTAGLPAGVAGERVEATPNAAAVVGTDDTALAVNPLDVSPSDEHGPVVLDRLNVGAPLRRRGETSVRTALGAALDRETVPAGDEVVSEADEDTLEASDLAELDVQRERPAAGLRVPVPAPEGLGGLGFESTVDVGLVARQAQEASQDVSLQTARFVRRSAVGAPRIDTRAPAPREAFWRRLNRRGDEPAGGRGRPSPQTEAAIELGLLFLSRHQAADGSWSLNHDFGRARRGSSEESAAISSDTAATALALLVFLGAGYDHQNDQYQGVVAAGLDFLLKHQKPDGDLYIDQDPNSTRSAWLYSHGIAAIALSEVFGMTQDATLRDPAQRALDFIASSQHRTRGGWRYAPGVSSDTSVTGWMMMALKSGELAGLTVDPSVFKKIDVWLGEAQMSEEGAPVFRYNPYAPDTDEQRHGREPSRAMTAVGLLMRLYSGWRRDNPRMIRGADLLLANPPVMGTSGDPRRDTYYWYYATQVMFHMGEQYWERWNRRLHPLLVDTQIQQGPLAGSWDPHTPVPDRWATHGGRLYVTTMNLLSLEVYYRHLPIYEQAVGWPSQAASAP